MNIWVGRPNNGWVSLFTTVSMSVPEHLKSGRAMSVWHVRWRLLNLDSSVWELWATDHLS